jgi:hypothetical protein
MTLEEQMGNGSSPSIKAMPFRFYALRNTQAPVITAKHVIDVTADSVADPFIIHDRRGPSLTLFRN